MLDTTEAKLQCITGDVTSLSKSVDKTEAWVSIVAESLASSGAHFAAIHLQAGSADNMGIVNNIHEQITGNKAIQSAFEGSVAFLQPNDQGLGNIYLFRSVEDVVLWHNGKFTALDRGHQNGPPTAIQHQNLPISNDARNFAAGPCGFNVVKFEFAEKIELTFVNLLLFSRTGVMTANLEKLGWREAATIRQEQLESINDFLQNADYSHSAQVLAGAFNVQLDEDTMLQELCHTQHLSLEQDNEKHQIRVFAELQEGRNLNLAKIDDGKFDFKHQDWLFGTAQGRFVKRYNGELRTSIKGKFNEKRVEFGPTRYFGDVERGKDVFLRVRCPAWADRVIFNQAFHDAAHNDAFCSSSCIYQCLGEGQNVGISKPVSFYHQLSMRRSWLH